MEHIEGGSLGTAKDAGKGDAGIVSRWKQEWSLADKVEKDWRKAANDARDIYRGKKKGQNSFNILWANTEVIAPNLYNSLPKPDVRRRYRDADPQGKVIAEILERALSFEIDDCDFDETMKGAVFDSVLPGRGTARIRFEPYYNETTDESGQPVKTLAGAKTYAEAVPWDTFRRGSASCWKDVPWIGYEHALTLEEIKRQFPGYENRVQYDVVIHKATEEVANREPMVFKRVRIWEIWDKETKKIYWIAPSYEEAPLLVEDDKLKLKNFFDMPKPIYSIEDTSSLEPVCEYSLYEDQAKELNRVTQRINKLTEALKVRGIYDSTIGELSALMQSSDNDMIPSVDATVVLQAGGFEKAIWMMPIEQIAKVLAQLYVQREQIKMTIYEVIGISDILRGSSDPNETLGAQELKAQTGSVRLQRRQRDVQRFAKDLIVIMSEIIAEHYPPELLTIMTGIQVTPDLMQIMQRDLLRGIRVDVETDSTIAADQARARKDVTEVMEAVGGFIQAFGPAVQNGAVSMEAAKKIFTSIIRKAKMGREVEDALEQDAAQPQQQKPDPEAMKLQAEQQKAQADMQLKQQQMQVDSQMKQQQFEADSMSKLADAKIRQDEMAQKAQLEAAKIALEREKIASNEQLKREEMMLTAQLKREEIEANANLRREEMAVNQETKLTEMDTNAQIRMKEIESNEDVDVLQQKVKSATNKKRAKDEQAAQSTAREERDRAEQEARSKALIQGMSDIQQTLVKLVEGVSAPVSIIRDKNGNIAGAK